MKRLRNVNGNTTYIYKEISFITILDVTTRRQSIANPPMEDSYGRLHMNIDVREIKQVVNILHIHHLLLRNYIFYHPFRSNRVHSSAIQKLIRLHI